YDISQFANYGGKNVLVVRVNAARFEGWFYEGAGIYRHVWLEKTSPIAIAPDGVFVTTSGIIGTNISTDGDPNAEITVEVRVRNSLDHNANCAVISTIGDMD